MGERWELHGIYLGVTSLAVMLFGVQQRNRCLAATSCCVMLGNGMVQSWNLLRAVPRWIYLSLTGALLLSLGALAEFRRDLLVQAKNKLSGQFR